MISHRKKTPWFLLVSLTLAVSTVALAQDKPGSDAPAPMAVDRGISAALQQVSAERIRANIEKLALERG